MTQPITQAPCQRVAAQISQFEFSLSQLLKLPGALEHFETCKKCGLLLQQTMIAMLRNAPESQRRFVMRMALGALIIVDAEYKRSEKIGDTVRDRIEKAEPDPTERDFHGSFTGSAGGCAGTSHS